MTHDELHDQIAIRFRRGAVVFRLLVNLAVVCAGFAYFLLPCAVAWIAVAWSISLLFYLGGLSSAKSLQLVNMVFERPSLVYWAQPVEVAPAKRHRSFLRMTLCSLKPLEKQLDEVRQLRADDPNVWEHVNLHLRDGNQLEVRLTRPEMRFFTSWLAEMNPSIRIGSYEDGGGTIDGGLNSAK